MNKTILTTGLVLGIVAIVLGAFGAHGLRTVLDPEKINTFETGVKYQMYHALFLVLLGTITMASEGVKRTVFYFILFGVVLFSFSIYLLATNALTSFDYGKIGFLTPIGGILMITGWAYLLFGIVKPKDNTIVP